MGLIYSPGDMIGAQNGAGMGQIRGMKVRSSVKKLCDGCKVRSISPPFSFLGVKGEEGEDHCFLGGRLG
jgi:hypothetical protein